MIQFIILYAFLIYILGFYKKKQSGVLCCGLVGYSGVEPANVDKLNFLMYNNSVERGKDSTGYYTQETGVHKDAVACADYLKKNKLPSSNVFIGHVRWKTVGANTVKNAHPFEYDNVVLAHNGTLQNHMSMLNNHGYSWRDYDVDSQVLAKLIDDNTKTDEEKKFVTLSEFDGAAALLWIDKRNPNKLYAYRNNERPLFCTNLGDNMYLSSLEDSLRIIGGEKIFILDPNYLYTIVDGKITSKVFYSSYVRSFFPQQNSNPNLSKNKDFIDIIDLNHKVNNNELLKKWIKCEVNIKSYRNTLIDLTVGKYYFVSDYDANGNWDIKVHDNKGTEVTVNKYWFNLGNLVFKEWAVLMYDIVSKDDPKDYVFKKNDIVKISSLEFIKQRKSLVGLIHEERLTHHFISTDNLRPATDAEIAGKLKEISDKLEKEKNANIIAEFKELRERNANTDVNEELEKLRQNEINDEQSVMNSNSKVNFDNSSSDDEEQPDLIELNLYTAVLDVISDCVDNIKEITNHLDLDVLHKSIEELDAIVEEAYDVDAMLEKFADEEEIEDKDKDKKTSCQC